MSSDALTDRRLNRDWTFFILLTFLFGFGFAINNGSFQNYFNSLFHTEKMPLMLGALESLREVPGLLAALLAGTLVALAESKVAGLGLGVCATGIGLTGFTESFALLILINVFWSIGFHLYASMQSAITLALSKGREGGRHLGKMAGVSGLSTISGLGFALGLRKLFPNAPYSVYFLIGGCFIMAAAVLCASLSAHAEGGKRQPIVLRREYKLYYWLIFLEGCRRQVFGTFAGIVLIKVFKTPFEHMLLLQFINSILIFVTAPRIGKLIDRVGERKPLTLYAVLLIPTFACYALFKNTAVLYAIYMLDNVLFSFAVGYTTYLNRIVRPGELTPSLTMGTTMNHIAAVTVPFLGAYFWVKTANYTIPFWIGVGVAMLALIGTQALPDTPHRPSSPKTDSEDERQALAV